MQSCLYEGVVTHRRRTPVKHAFRSRLWMALLDLDELPDLVGPGRLLSGRRFAAHSFLPSDHLFGRAAPLSDEIRCLVTDSTGDAPTGPVRLLTQLRCAGIYFSPLNLFYLYGQSGDDPQCVVAEVNNTPWGERCCYVLDARKSLDAGANSLRFRHGKEMHVSPFMAMNLEYVWRMTAPGQRVSIGLACQREKSELFHAALVLQRKELTSSNLRWALLRRPVVGAQTILAIYFQALRLWWKRCPAYPHPNSK